MARIFLILALFAVSAFHANAALVLAGTDTQTVSVTEISASPTPFTLTFDKYNPLSYGGNPLAAVVIEFEATVAGDMTATATGEETVEVRAVFQLQLFISTDTDDALGLSESNVSAYLTAIASEPAVGTIEVEGGTTVPILNVSDSASSTPLSITDFATLLAYTGGPGETLSIDILLQAIATPQLFGTPVEVSVTGGGSGTATISYYYEEETAIPEPSTVSMLLLCAGMVGLVGLRNKHARKA